MKSGLKKILCLMISMVLLTSTTTLLPIDAEATKNPFKTNNYVEIDGFRFYLWDPVADGGEDRGAILVSYSGENPNPNVPGLVEGRPVTEIYRSAFNGLTNLLTVSLPNSITQINFRAFYNCSHLTEITLPAELKTIGSQAFMGCAHLWNLTLPDSIEDIGLEAFSGCELLTEFVIPAGIKDYSFLRDSYIRTITMKEGIEEIPNYAFKQCTLNTVYLPDSVKKIGSYAFRNTGLSHMEFGSNLETISSEAFSETNLTQVIFPASLKSIGSKAFESSDLISVTLPDGLESISSYAFSNCSLKELHIPDSVSFLGRGILKGNWEYIEQVTLPKALQSAEYGVFEQSNVKNVVIPDTVGNPIPLSENMFAQSGEDNVSDLWFEGQPDQDTIQAAIAGCGVSRLHFLQAPNATLKEAINTLGYKYMGNSDGYYNYLLGKYASNSIQSGSWIFHILKKQSDEVELIGYSGIPEENGVITIPETVSTEGITYSVVSIGKNCFSHLDHIRKVVAPASVRIIGDYAFEECTALEEVYFPNESLNIGKKAFKNCRNLSVYSGASPIGINVEAFFGDINLQELPSFDNTNYIYDNAFENVGQNVPSPLPITFGEHMQIIGYGAFANANITFTVLPEKISVDSYAFCGTKVESITLYDNVSCGCFMNCKSLIRAEISGVETIECLAFSGCDSLQEVVTDTALKCIGPYSFRNCPMLSFAAQGNVTICDFAFCMDSGDALVLHGTDGCADFSSCDCIIIDYMDKLVIEEGVETVKYLIIVNLNEIIIPSSFLEFKRCNFVDGRVETVWCNSEAIIDTNFQDLEIDTIVFGENVTSIPAICSYNRTLKKVVFLGPVSSIRKRAFYQCFALETVECATPIETVEEEAFCFCDSLDYSSLPLIKNIGGGAFCFCQIRRLELPEGTIAIDKNAFCDCGIETLVLPISLQKLDNSAFSKNPLQNIVYNCKNLQLTLKEHAFSSESAFYLSPFYAYGLQQEISLGMSVITLPPFLFCKMNLDTIVIPAGVTDIPQGSFAYSTIREVQCNGTLESIGNNAFSHCVNLISAPINDGLMLIGSHAFSECTKLNEIVIPETTVDIAEYAFMHCDRLVSARISEQVVFLSNGLFKNCGCLAEVEWNCTHKYIGNEAFLNCFSLSVFSFDNISKLYEDSFKGSGLTQAVLGETSEGTASELQEISDRSFEKCTTLTMIAVGGQVSSIESYAFADCENLETALLSDSVESISSDAFKNCPKLRIYCTEESYAYNYAVENDIPVSTFVVEPIPNQRYTGKDIEPPVSVSVSGAPLSKGVDFKVRYSDNVNAGTASVKVSGINTYKMFTSTVNFVILTRDISEAEIKDIDEQKFTGSAVTPKVRVTYNGKTLREGTDYNVVYSNNTSVGTAKATLTGIGNFSGTAKTEFSIVESNSPITPPWHGHDEDPEEPSQPENPSQPGNPSEPGNPGGDNQGDNSADDGGDNGGYLTRVLSWFTNTLIPFVFRMLSAVIRLLTRA